MMEVWYHGAVKKFLLGFVAGLFLSGFLFAGYPVIRGFFASEPPVAPDKLNPAATDFGGLRVTVTGMGRPVANLEVDLGTPGGRMSNTITDVNGVALFKHVSVGDFNIFFNDLNYPQQFARVSSLIPVQIMKDQTVEKSIALMPR